MISFNYANLDIGHFRGECKRLAVHRVVPTPGEVLHAISSQVVPNIQISRSVTRIQVHWDDPRSYGIDGIQTTIVI